MPLVRFLKALFGAPPRGADGSAEALLGDVMHFLEGTDGRFGASRRLQGIVLGFGRLGGTERARFAEMLSRLEEGAAAGVGRRYARMEESELFGTRRDRLAAFEALEPPLRRLLLSLRGIPGGTDMLAALTDLGPARLSREIAALGS